MKAFRRVALVALVLVSAVVVVASPAFATPRLTTSTGTRPDGGAVSPFVSPIGDTLTNSITVTTAVAAGTRRGSSLSVTSLARAADAITCIRVTASGEVPSTHTRLAIYSLDFLGCRDDTLGAVVHVVVNHISSSNPYYFHLTTNNGGGSGTAVFEIPTGSTIDIFVKNAGIDVCQVTVGPQSVNGVVITDGSVSRARTINVASTARSVRFALPRALTTGCPDPAQGGTQNSVTAIPFTFDGLAANTPVIQTTSRLP